MDDEQSAWQEKVSEDRTLVVGVYIIALIAAIVALYFNGMPTDWNYWFAASIGLAVGATEMMARYRDAPFAPIVSFPGLAYVGVNAGASLLAYYLIDTSDLLDGSPALRVLTAGIGAMAFFRSGLFTARLGDEDVAVGPNIILQIMLQALDRAYDRDRSEPRSINAVGIMSGISFAQSKKALPSICFNLMQNVSPDEMAALAKEVEGLEQQPDIPDEAKSLILGLALMNIVGKKTLGSAVAAMGTSLRESKRIDPALLAESAKIEPAKIIAALPRVCNAICHRSRRVEKPQDLIQEVVELDLDEENRAVLVLHRLIQVYGQSTVGVALGTMIPLE